MVLLAVPLAPAASAPAAIAGDRPSFPREFEGDGSKDLALLQRLTPASHSLDICLGSGGTRWSDLRFPQAGAAGALRPLGLGAPAASGALLVGTSTLYPPFQAGAIVPEFVPVVPVATGLVGGFSLAVS